RLHRALTVDGADRDRVRARTDVGELRPPLPPRVVADVGAEFGPRPVAVVEADLDPLDPARLRPRRLAVGLGTDPAG
ncbi:hypothetical protein KCW65_30030, partial [Mycobacterium tuberculosis]|nr:hypothetical protein [Mycobacterium tuberculosis]